MPDGPATSLTVMSPLIRVVKGRILTEVHVFLDKLFHVVRVNNVPGVDGTAIEVRVYLLCVRACVRPFLPVYFR